jgi:hypothetical protein
MEYLQNSQTDRLHGILEQALRDQDLINSFIDLSKTLCEDSADALNEFRARICEALALSLETRASRFDDESCQQLGKLLVVAHYVFKANATNPSWYKPPSLALVLSECLRILEGLAIDEEIPVWARSSEEADAPQPDVRDQAWGHVYLQCFDPLIVGCEMGIVKDTPALLDRVKRLVERQLQWGRRGLGPVECNNALVIDVWGETFSLVENLRDGTFAERILGAVTELRGRSSGSPSQSPGSWFSQDEEDVSRLLVEDALTRCEKSGILALAACQETLAAVPLWKEILAERPVTSWLWRTAVVALAELDISEAPPYLVNLLHHLGASQSQDVRKRFVLCHRLMQFLDKPGAHNPCVEVFDSSQEIQVPLGLHDSLKKLFQRMLDKPNKKWSKAAIKNLRYVLDTI